MDKQLKLPAHFTKSWEVYTQLNYQAIEISKLLGVKNPVLENDHIALRTFSGLNTGLKKPIHTT